MHAHDIVSVVELVFYVPTAVLALITCHRHSFRRSSGWIYTLLLCIVRIAGAICELLTRSNHSSGLIKATYVIDSIGLSPLLLATLGMLTRFVDFINTSSTPAFTSKHLRILQLLIVLGLILSIVGGTSGTTNSNGTVQVATTSKAGIVLYIVAYAAILLIYFASVIKTSLVPKKERRVPVAIALALPFILVRLIYSACVVFVHNHLFNIVTGSVAVFVAMAVVEEFIVVSIYILLGFLLSKLDNGIQGPIAGRNWNGKMNNVAERESMQTTDELEAQKVNMGGQDQGVRR